MSNTNQNNYSVEIDYNNGCVNYYDRSGNYITEGAQLLEKGTIAFFSDFKIQILVNINGLEGIYNLE
jgi:hypothetical protein